MTLGRRTLDAARWNTTSTVVRAIVQLAQIAVLARFLLPKDYGLMAMVAVVLSYATLFSDMGISTAFVQRQQINNQERSSLYWFSVVLGAGLMLLVMASSPLAANFFKEPKLVPLMILASTNFLVVSLGQQLRIDAEKGLNFRPVALIEIAASITGFCIAVLGALLGWGVYALVIASIISTWVSMFLSWGCLANGWRPEWRLNWNEIKWFAYFGGAMVVNNIVNHINTTVDILLGGRILGFTQLGLYSIPRNLTLQVQFMVNPIFTRIGFPLIASIQNDKEKVKQAYLRTMNMTASVNAPIYVAIGVFAPEIIFFLLGEKWQEAAPLLRVLAIWGLLRSFFNPVGSLLFGLGRIRLSTKWNASMLLIVPPFVWFGSHWGAIGMAWAMALLMGLLFVPGWAILIRPTCGAKLDEYAKQVIMPTLCASFAGYVAWMTVILVNGAAIRLTIGLISGSLIYIASSWVVNRIWVESVISALKLK